MEEKEETLLKMYSDYLEEFKRSGYHPHPANLLAMQLLPEKAKFEALRLDEGEFYEHYKEEFNSKIAQVTSDFNLDKREIIAFIESAGIFPTEARYEEEKIWFVFAEGFGIMHGEMMYRPQETSIEMYNCLDNKSKLYKMTDEGLLEYHHQKRGKMKIKK